MTKRLITIDDVQRTNSRLMGKTCKVVLSTEDIIMFERIRRTLFPIKDTPELRNTWKKAQESYVTKF